MRRVKNLFVRVRMEILGRLIVWSPVAAFFLRQLLRRKIKKINGPTRDTEGRRDVPRWLEEIELLRLLLNDLFPNRYDLQYKLEREYVSINIPLLPNFLINRKWKVGGKSWQLSEWKGYVNIAKHEGRPWWDNINLQFGRLLAIRVRWDKGQRKYVRASFWLYRYDPPFGLIKGNFGLYDFVHEIQHVNNNRFMPISRWWWGSGLFNMSMGSRFPIMYRKFGKLFHFVTKDGLKGYLGVDLTPAQKSAVYLLFKDQDTEDKFPRYDYPRIWLDAVLGRNRNQFEEYYSVRCIVCGVRHNPTYYDHEFPNMLRCGDCESEYWTSKEAVA